jgi:hypothetical protein
MTAIYFLLIIILPFVILINSNKQIKKKNLHPKFRLYILASLAFPPLAIGVWIYLYSLKVTVLDQLDNHTTDQINKHRNSGLYPLGGVLILFFGLLINTWIYFKIDNYYKFKNDTIQFNNIRAIAKNGNESAQLSLGYMYGKGIGTKENIDSAMYWFNKSAKQGNDTARFEIKYFQDPRWIEYFYPNSLFIERMENYLSFKIPLQCKVTESYLIRKVWVSNNWVVKIKLKEHEFRKIILKINKNDSFWIRKNGTFNLRKDIEEDHGGNFIEVIGHVDATLDLEEKTLYYSYYLNFM